MGDELRADLQGAGLLGAVATMSPVPSRQRAFWPQHRGVPSRRLPQTSLAVAETVDQSGGLAMRCGRGDPGHVGVTAAAAIVASLGRRVVVQTAGRTTLRITVAGLFGAEPDLRVKIMAFIDTEGHVAQILVCSWFLPPPGRVMPAALVRTPLVHRLVRAVVVLVLAVSGMAVVGVADATVPGPWAVVTAGGNSGCAIRGTTTGAMWCWGWNLYGQVGDGTTTTTATPEQIGTDTTWKQVSLGYQFTCAIKTNGTLWCWGHNNNGQLGIGSTTDAHAPHQVGTLTTWRTVSGGGYHTCATRTDSSLWCWGYNANRQVGDGSATNRTSPVHIGTATWKSVAAGDRHNCAIQANGSLWCWGYNPAGELGDGTTTVRSVPTAVATGTTWTALAAGYEDTCGLHPDKTLWCWGYNAYGQIGDGTKVNRLVPTKVGAAANWTQLTTGGALNGGATCALNSTHQLWCWGRNDGGQVGDGTTTTRLSPVHIGTATNWATVSMGGGYYGGHACARQANSTMWCWGGNRDGDTGVGNFTQMLLVPTLIGTAT